MLYKNSDRVTLYFSAKRFSIIFSSAATLRLIGSIFPQKFQFQNKKVRTADINPILHKIAHFTRVNKENKKRDKSQKQDLSRCVDNSLEISNIFTPRDFELTMMSIHFILSNLN